MTDQKKTTPPPSGKPPKGVPAMDQKPAANGPKVRIESGTEKPHTVNQRQPIDTAPPKPKR